LAPPPVRASGSILERAYAAAGRRAGDRAHRRLAAAGTLAPRLTAALACAFALAALVHLLVAALLLGGLALIWLAFPNPFALLLGGLMVAAGVFMRPRLGTPPSDRLAGRSEARALWHAVDEVAAAVGTAPPDRIVIESACNASWQVAGFRRRRVLTLGMPLLAVLTPGGRVALLAHELAHARNGDVARGWFIGSAVGALEELCGMLRASSGAPRDAADPGFENTGVLDWFTNGILRAVGLPVWGILLLEVHLLMQDSRRAEYLADALAADVAGSDGVIALHEALLLDSVLEQPVQRRAVVGSRAADGLLEELVAAVRAVPPRERARRRRVARLEGTRLLASHPPTGLRIALIEERAGAEPRVTMETEAWMALDAGLARFVPEVERELLDWGSAVLYAY
jgi:Zn-dependent protease with chaperone function